MNVLSALREFLAATPLSTEAQKIDMQIDEFAAQRPHLGDPETVHVLCFSILMLNTDLHVAPAQNSGYKRMTVDQFIRNLRGVNVSEADLISVFNDVAANPITKM